VFKEGEPAPHDPRWSGSGLVEKAVGLRCGAGDHAVNYRMIWWHKLLEPDEEECAALVAEIQSLGYSHVSVKPRGARLDIAFRDWRTSRSRSFSFTSAEHALSWLRDRIAMLITEV